MMARADYSSLVSFPRFIVLLLILVMLSIHLADNTLLALIVVGEIKSAFHLISLSYSVVIQICYLD